MENTSTNWSKTTIYIVGVGLALFGIFVLYLSRPVIPPLVIAALIAIIVRPLILWLHSRAHLSLSLSVIMVYLILAILFPLALLLAMPAILDTIHFISNLDYLSIFQNLIVWLRSMLIMLKALPLPMKIMNLYVDQMVDALLKAIDQTAIISAAPASVDSILQSLSTALSATFRTAAGVVSSFVSSITLLLFTFLASVYMSLGAQTLHEGIVRAAPARFRPELAILITRIERSWKAFFRGELTLMLFIGVIDWLGLTILGVPGALYLGIISGLLEIVPNIGPVLATIPAVIVALLQGSNYLRVSPPFLGLLVVLFYTLVQQLENNLIVPKVLGKAMDLPALVVMIGVLVGAEAGGLLGVLLATPVIATMREIVSYLYRKILGEDPYPPEEESQTLTAPPPNDPWYWRERVIHILGRLSKRPSQEQTQSTERIHNLERN